MRARFWGYLLLGVLSLAATVLKANSPHTLATVGTIDTLVVGTPTASSQNNVNATNDGHPQNETSIAQDPTNLQSFLIGPNDWRLCPGQQVVGCADAGVTYSLAGGAVGTWTNTTLATLNPLLGKYTTEGDPSVVALGNGVFYYAFLDLEALSTERNRLLPQE